MMKKLIYLAFVTALIYGCSPTKTITLPEQTIKIQDPNKVPERAVYNPSKTRKYDLLHTKLDVKFNWEKAYLYGKAELTLTPYFYATDRLILDAKGFDIHKVELLDQLESKELKYDYDQLLITIQLDKEYTKKDTIKIRIDYTAKPNELEIKGSSAITSDKGLYFINPDNSEKDKPRQVWTQGETQASSCWFPTIDAPNERCTGEISITVEEKFKTLSNGVLMHQELNGDGTRTDFWEMDLPHAPYLFMMAAGDYAVVKDKWRDKEVNYYVEHEYEEYAKDIFGLTPEMLDVFSDKLGVDYPWQKYSQIVVRDYVSGAMENTSAVIHGEFLNRTKREMLDEDNEDIIAHELFHHWFGDLVTCESWANLPLNESFATYGEVIWNEHKYGQDKADHGLQVDLSNYLQEAKNKQEDLIRFNYNDKEDMFDGHTYQKGSRILHMLRNYVGDEAFFASLQKYLTDNKYTDVEMHELRIAFEEVTGEDLNWFFNQWFYASGHPLLDVNYEYNSVLQIQTVIIEQQQDLKSAPLYRLPITIDIYVGGKKETKKVVIDKVTNKFEFTATTKPDLVNVDADKMLLCEKRDNKELSEWAFMFYNAPRYLDRYEAIQHLSKSGEELATNTLIDALSDPYDNIRRKAVAEIKKAANSQGERVKNKLIDLAKNDRESKVRGDAVDALATYFGKEEGLEQIYIAALADSSYYVIASGLTAFSDKGKEAMIHAKKLEEEKNSMILNAIASIYASYGDAKQNDFFINAANKIKGLDKFQFIQSYGDYLNTQDDVSINKGLPLLREVAMDGDPWWLRMAGIQALKSLETMYSSRIQVYEKELKDLEKGSAKELNIKSEITIFKVQRQGMEKILAEVKEKESDPNLKRMLGVQ